MPVNPYPVERETRTGEELMLPNTVVQSLVVKQKIIRQVIEGRMELQEAALRFHAVNRVAAAFIEQATGVPAAAANAESLCRTLIGWVYLTLSYRPEEAERVSNRLERELESQLEKQSQANSIPTK